MSSQQSLHPSSGARIEMSGQTPLDDFVQSHPSLGAWIEMPMAVTINCTCWSHLTLGARTEILNKTWEPECWHVTSFAGYVDCILNL